MGTWDNTWAGLGLKAECAVLSELVMTDLLLVLLAKAMAAGEVSALEEAVPSVLCTGRLQLGLGVFAAKPWLMAAGGARSRGETDVVAL